METTKPNIPWDVINPKYKYFARDQDGSLWLYTHSPVLSKHRFNYNSYDEFNCCSYKLDSLLTLHVGTCDWQDSLVSRPNI